MKGMTHYESIDPDKVKEIFARSFAIDKRTGKIKACIELDCGNCLFNHVNSNAPCRVARMKWLDQPAVDPEKDIDWSKVPVDTPVMVWNFEDHLYKRYFSGIKDERFGTYVGGCTSWSITDNKTDNKIIYWPHCNLYRPEDVEKYRKKDTENG
jgi:hypothetical protein